MRLFHRTFAADSILKEGFQDGVGTYLTTRVWTGVWFSDVPLDINEGADGDTLLTVEIPEAEIEFYEWLEEGKGYREFLIPATLVNRFGPPIITEGEGE